MADRIIITPEAATAAAPLKPGDGVVFDAADWRSPNEPEEGGRVYHVTPLRNGQLELEFGNGALNPARIRPGDWLWRTDDPELDRLVRPLTEAHAPVQRQPVYVRVVAHEGSPLTLHWALVNEPDTLVTVQADTPLSPAQNQALSANVLREQLGRLGNTPYALADMQLDLRGRPFAPTSLLNQLRRQAVELLAERQGRPRNFTVNEPLAVLETALAHAPQPPARAEQSVAQLHLLVRTPEQLDAALELRPASITLDYLELYGLRPAVERVQAAGIVARVASPRVLKPNEQRVVRFLLKLGCEIVVRSSGLLQALQAEEHPALIGDFSLNAANVLAADTFLQLGLARLTPTHDLNAAQVADLARRLGPERLEVVAYQHLPVFHTEHCVFCRFLSTGTSYKDCGHPCETHRIALRDQNGREHPVMADVGCRNTVFGAEAQEASRHMDSWRAAGIGHFRLEFVHETAAEVTQVGRAFRDYLAGRSTAAELTRQLQRVAPQGTTEGSLFVPENYMVIPLMQ
jgi:putative protease